MKNCLICERIKLIKQGKNKYFVVELRTGFVVLGDTQFNEGYTLFLSNEHKFELHELNPYRRMVFLEDMAVVAKAVYKAFKPEKLNYELMGNTDKHMHWHIIPRYETEEHPEQPYWCYPKELRNNPKYKPTDEQLKVLREEVLKNV